MIPIRAGSQRSVGNDISVQRVKGPASSYPIQYKPAVVVYTRAPKYILSIPNVCSIKRLSPANPNHIGDEPVTASQKP